ncbi:hypothetical protein OE810_05680 [Rhodobacteraceae bacterium XHP0102]|nr:hypothetical protein [Rhodobacteraceae bacterium XHP0102]
MHDEAQQSDTAATLPLPARVDGRAVQALRKALLEVDAPVLTIDATAVQFLSAAALELLMIAAAQRRAQAQQTLWRGGTFAAQLALLGASPQTIFTGEAA